MNKFYSYISDKIFILSKLQNFYLRFLSSTSALSLKLPYSFFLRLGLICFIYIIPVKAASNTLPIPRFVSIKFNEVNARTGPAIDCPIEWVFTVKGEPVEIIAEYEQWRKIKDVNGEGGWVHSSAISGNRHIAIISKNVMPLLSTPADYNSIVVKVSPSLRCRLIKCKGEWCQINCDSYKGWITKKYLWGVYPEE